MQCIRTFPCMFSTLNTCSMLSAQMPGVRVRVVERNRAHVATDTLPGVLLIHVSDDFVAPPNNITVATRTGILVLELYLPFRHCLCLQVEYTCIHVHDI